MTDLLQGARFAGFLLAGGGVLLVLLVGPSAFVPSAIWTGARDASLRLVARHNFVWKSANVGFALATILTAAGLILMPGLVGDLGSALAWAAAVLFLLAAVPWLLILTIRLVITPGVANSLAADGTLDPDFIPIDRLSGALFPAFMVIASGSIVVLGAAVVAGGSLSPILGWACVAAGLAMGSGYLLLGDMLPAFVYFPTTAVGIVLLLTAR
jgi:hypothetical protein